jgi:predicted acylesterase/phospholipase RssA
VTIEPRARRLAARVDGGDVDGGVAEPVPVRRTLALGHDRAVVVLTQPRGYRRQRSRRTAYLLGRTYPRYPALARALASRSQAANDALDHIDDGDPRRVRQRDHRRRRTLRHRDHVVEASPGPRELGGHARAEPASQAAALDEQRLRTSEIGSSLRHRARGLPALLSGLLHPWHRARCHVPSTGLWLKSRASLAGSAVS